MEIGKLMFHVDDDGAVSLCVGCVQVKVCECVEDFPDFREEVILKLNSINDEMQENYA
tara:strand:- start:4364 stop:4537 length:174 start_codon:yes stop_codon:yes gene_type:complete